MGGTGCAGPAQHGPLVQAVHAGRRAWHLVVSAHLQADDAVYGFSDRRQHDDRYLEMHVQVAADVGSAFAGQHDIENDQFDKGKRRRAACISSSSLAADTDMPYLRKNS